MASEGRIFQRSRLLIGNKPPAISSTTGVPRQGGGLACKNRDLIVIGALCRWHRSPAADLRGTAPKPQRRLVIVMHRSPRSGGLLLKVLARAGPIPMRCPNRW